MEYIIRNEYLEATISSHGAELIKLIDKDGINRLHTPSDDTWNRVSPILFPQISRLPNAEYKANDNIYKMTTHGFIRDNELELVNCCETEITFKYSHNEKTLIMYPYKFNFYVTYKLLDNTLVVIFKVENPSDEVLRYMLGGHPGFKIPLYENESYSDYSVIFEKKETVKRMCLVDGFLANKYEDYYLDSINLNHNLFIDDALIFRGLNSNYVDIISKNHNKKIRFHFAGFEILAIWSKTKENCDFLCLEPWNGIQKEFVLEHEKMGVLEIEPHNISCSCYKIEVI
jgi:galactose mutarotase-like enzyme